MIGWIKQWQVTGSELEQEIHKLAVLKMLIVELNVCFHCFTKTRLCVIMKNCNYIPIIFLCTWFNLCVSVGAIRIVFVVPVSCLFPGSTFLSALSVQHIWPSLLVCGWVGRGRWVVKETNVVTAAPHFSIRAQWSGDLWVWLHPPRLAADPQCCGAQEWEDGKIIEIETALPVKALNIHFHAD